MSEVTNDELYHNQERMIERLDQLNGRVRKNEVKIAVLAGGLLTAIIEAVRSLLNSG